eukprot:453573_1
MTIEDTVSIVLLYYRVFVNLEENINERSDEFVVTRNVFQRFCDRDNFQEMSNTATEASDLFQNVIETEKNYITLGEIRQTIIHLVNDVDNMQAGSLIRIKNYLMQRVQKDEHRRTKNLPKYKKKIEQWKHDRSKHKKPTNPKINYKMISVSQFSQFVKKISDGYVPNVDAHRIVTKHKGDEKKDHIDDDDNEEYSSDLFSRISSVAICVVDDKQIEENQLQSDIEKMIQNLANLENDVKEEEVKENIQKEKYSYKEAVDTEKMNRKYKTVHDSMLKKYEHGITLQQVLFYFQSFRRWLQANEFFISLIYEYDEAEDYYENEDVLFKLQEKMKKTKIGSYAQFFAKYFNYHSYKNKKFTKKK